MSQLDDIVIDYDHPLPFWGSVEDRDKKLHTFPTTGGVYTLVSWDDRFTKIVAAHQRVLKRDNHLYLLLKNMLESRCSEKNVEEQVCNKAKQVLYTLYQRVRGLNKKNNYLKRALVEASLYEAHYLLGKRYKLENGREILGRLFRHNIYLKRTYDEMVVSHISHLVTRLGLPSRIESLAYEIARKILYKRRERYSPSTLAALTTFIASNIYGYNITKTRVARILGINYMSIIQAMKKTPITIEVRSTNKTKIIVLGRETYAPPSPPKNSHIHVRVANNKIIVTYIPCK